MENSDIPFDFEIFSKIDKESGQHELILFETIEGLVKDTVIVCQSGPEIPLFSLLTINFFRRNCSTLFILNGPDSPSAPSVGDVANAVELTRTHPNLVYAFTKLLQTKHHK